MVRPFGGRRVKTAPTCRFFIGRNDLNSLRRFRRRNAYSPRNGQREIEAAHLPERQEFNMGKRKKEKNAFALLNFPFFPFLPRSHFQPPFIFTFYFFNPHVLHSIHRSVHSSRPLFTEFKKVIHLIHSLIHVFPNHLITIDAISKIRLFLGNCRLFARSCTIFPFLRLFSFSALRRQNKTAAFSLRQSSFIRGLNWGRHRPPPPRPLSGCSSPQRRSWRHCRYRGRDPGSKWLRLPFRRGVPWRREGPKWR